MPFRNFLIYGSLVRLALLLKVVLYSVLFLSGILLFLLSLLHFKILIFLYFSFLLLCHHFFFLFFFVSSSFLVVLPLFFFFLIYFFV